MRTVLLTVLSALALALLTTSALAQAKAETKNKSDLPPGAIGSGAITIKQITDKVQYLLAEKYGIVVHFVLPSGWELKEQGIDEKTKKLREDLNVYSLISRAPVPDPKEPTDLIFELDIYKRGLLEDPPKDLKKGDDPMAVQFANFLNEQLSINVKGGLKRLTPNKDVVPKAYGPKDRPTFFVPVSYEVPNGSKLYTFTSVVGDKIWMLKFLVSKGQEDTYGALIAFVLYNSFGMTKAAFEDWMKNQPKGEMKPPPPPPAKKKSGK